MNHVLSNVVHPVHVRRHDTQNDAFVISKVCDQSSVHVRREHVGDDFTHRIAAEVLEDANSLFDRFEKQWRRIILEINGDTEETDDANEVDRVA